MKDLVVITAHCPTKEQEEALNKYVDSVLKLGFHILLLSHSHIPIHIQKKCNYYFYDYDNDLSEDHNLLGFYTFSFEDKKIHSKYFIKNFYGFAIYRMFSIASQIAINFGYDYIHNIEYDCELLDEKLIIENKENLKEYDSVICTDTGDENGWLYGSFKSFRVKSLPDKFKNYDRNFIENEMKNLKTTHLEYLTKKLFIDSGKTLFKKEPPSDKFKKGNISLHRYLHFTLYYEPESKTLNIFYNAMNLNYSEEIVVIVNKEKIVKFKTTPKLWSIRVLGIFNEITHVRVDNNKKVIYELTFDDKFREIFKNKSYIMNNKN